MYALSPTRVQYLNKPVLYEFMLNRHFFVLYLLQTCNINNIKTICCLEKQIGTQNIAIIISRKCVNNGKCPFNTDSLDHKQPFSLLSSARSCDVKRWHYKSLHIIPVNTLSATFIQE